MIKINLVPAEILSKARQKQQMMQVAAGGVAVLVIVGLISAVHWFQLGRLESQLADGQGRLKKLEVIVAKVEELERTAAAVRARLGVITDLLKGRPLYPYFMSDFVRSVPPGIRVKTLSTAGGGSSAGPLKLTMAAESRSNTDIAAWVKKMEESGKFSAIELGPVTSLTGGFSFTLTSVYTPAL